MKTVNMYQEERTTRPRWRLGGDLDGRRWSAGFDGGMTTQNVRNIRSLVGSVLSLRNATEVWGLGPLCFDKQQKLLDDLLLPHALRAGSCFSLPFSSSVALISQKMSEKLIGLKPSNAVKSSICIFIIWLPTIGL